MAEEQKQSQRDVSALDPEVSEREHELKQRLLWHVFFAGVMLLVIGAALYMAGLENIGLAVSGLGLVMIAPLLIFKVF